MDQQTAQNTSSVNSGVSGESDRNVVLASPSSGAGAPPGTGVAGAASSGSSQQGSAQFDIPDFVRHNYPGLVPLVLETKSMNDEERQYWFHILPIMTTDQVKKFQDILVTEKEQLQKLDKEYEEELTSINEKQVSSWESESAKAKREAMKEKELTLETEEMSQEEALLQNLDSV